MDLYLAVKTVHILSAAVLFGTGAGIAFFMLMAHLTRDVATIAATARIVVIADFVFTLPAVVVQPATGLWLIWQAGFAVTEPWLLLAYVLYVLVGACWIPVVFLQIKARDLAAAAREQGTPLPAAYTRAFRIWFCLGWPAFAGVVAIYALMLFKPEF
ncbi:MAG: DUF2269 domain-containing protein [Alphaproteobacteria bacterium]|jgi:uncharacterized membrane protein|nr:DUF2269 domain-containing protein [Alphaproteobacteria bacterium]